MTQLELPGPTPLEPTDAQLKALGLPYESADAQGRRLCRHHGQPIRSRGEPCAACRKAGEGVGEPEAT